MKKITNRNMLLTVAIVFAAGALLRRVFPLAGLVVIACALLFYVLCRAGRAIRTIRNFSRASGAAKGLLFVWVGMALSAWSVVWAIFRGGDVSYFLVLVLLAADFLLRQKNMRNGK
jgi:hypothetical protein